MVRLFDGKNDDDDLVEEYCAVQCDRALHLIMSYMSHLSLSSCNNYSRIDVLYFVASLFLVCALIDICVWYVNCVIMHSTLD